MKELISELERERDDLLFKLNNMDNFFNTDKFKSLSFINKSLLTRQNKIMNQYIDVLDDRIKEILEENGQ